MLPSYVSAAFPPSAHWDQHSLSSARVFGEPKGRMGVGAPGVPCSVVSGRSGVCRRGRARPACSFAARAPAEHLLCVGMDPVLQTHSKPDARGPCPQAIQLSRGQSRLTDENRASTAITESSLGSS